MVISVSLSCRGLSGSQWLGHIPRLPLSLWFPSSEQRSLLRRGMVCQAASHTGDPLMEDYRVDFVFILP